MYGEECCVRLKNPCVWLVTDATARSMGSRADPSSTTRGFIAFATSGWRLSRLENGLRIFEQDEYGKDDEVGQGGKTSGSSFVVHGSDDDDPVTTNAADIKAPGCKVRRAIDWVYFKHITVSFSSDRHNTRCNTSIDANQPHLLFPVSHLITSSQ